MIKTMIKIIGFSQFYFHRIFVRFPSISSFIRFAFSFAFQCWHTFVAMARTYTAAFGSLLFIAAYNARSHNSWIVLIPFLLPAVQIGEAKFAWARYKSCLAVSISLFLSPRFYSTKISVTNMIRWTPYETHGHVCVCVNTTKTSGACYRMHTRLIPKRPIRSALSIGITNLLWSLSMSSFALKVAIQTIHFDLFHTKRSQFKCRLLSSTVAFPSAVRNFFMKISLVTAAATTASCTWTILLRFFVHLSIRRTRFSAGQ